MNFLLFGSPEANGYTDTSQSHCEVLIHKIHRSPRSPTVSVAGTVVFVISAVVATTAWHKGAGDIK